MPSSTLVDGAAQRYVPVVTGMFQQRPDLAHSSHRSLAATGVVQDLLAAPAGSTGQVLVHTRFESPGSYKLTLEFNCDLNHTRAKECCHVLFDNNDQPQPPMAATRVWVSERIQSSPVSAAVTTTLQAVPARAVMSSA